MIINKPHTCTKLVIWQPKYSAAYGVAGERVALLAAYKVRHATSTIIIEFTKAKHLEGQRFAIKREDAMRFPIDSNGKIDCYAVPMSALVIWESGAEVLAIVNEIFRED